MSYIVLTGLAAGVVGFSAIGDAVVGSEVLHYEPGRRGGGMEVSRAKVRSMLEPWLTNEIRRLQLERLDSGMSVRGQLLLGTVASGEKMIQGTEYIRTVAPGWGDVVAVDMESAGVAQAVSMYGSRIPLLVVYGIADVIGDDNKMSVDSSREFATKSAVQAVVEVATILGQRSQWKG